MTAPVLEDTGPVGGVILGQARLRLVYSPLPLANITLRAGLEAVFATKHAEYLERLGSQDAAAGGMEAGRLAEGWSKLQRRLEETDYRRGQIVHRTVWKDGTQ